MYRAAVAERVVTQGPAPALSSVSSDPSWAAVAAAPVLVIRIPIANKSAFYIHLLIQHLFILASYFNKYSFLTLNFSFLRPSTFSLSQNKVTCLNIVPSTLTKRTTIYIYICMYRIPRFYAVTQVGLYIFDIMCIVFVYFVELLYY